MSHSMSSHVSIKTMSVCAHIKIVPHLPAQASHLLHPHSIGARVHELCSDKVRAQHRLNLFSTLRPRMRSALL